MRPLALCAAAALFLCGCSASRGTTPKPDHAKAVDALKLVVRLHSAATQADFAAFQSKVDKAYNDTLSGYYGAQEAGFVYSLSPAGAANAFSLRPCPFRLPPAMPCMSQGPTASANPA